MSDEAHKNDGNGIPTRPDVFATCIQTSRLFIHKLSNVVYYLFWDLNSELAWKQTPSLVELSNSWNRGPGCGHNIGQQN